MVFLADGVAQDGDEVGFELGQSSVREQAEEGGETAFEELVNGFDGCRRRLLGGVVDDSEEEVLTGCREGDVARERVGEHGDRGVAVFPIAVDGLRDRLKE